MKRANKKIVKTWGRTPIKY